MVLHLNKFESPLPRDALCQVWLKLTQWLLRRRFLNFVNVFSLHVLWNYLPLEKGGALHLNILEFPLPKDALCQFWLKLVLWFWRRTFLNFVSVFSLFHNYLPLEKGGTLHLNKFEFPFTEGCFVSILVEIGPMVLEKKMKIWKVYDNGNDDW